MSLFSDSGSHCWKFSPPEVNMRVDLPVVHAVVYPTLITQLEQGIDCLYNRNIQAGVRD